MQVRDYRSEDFEKLFDLWDELGLNYPERGDNEETINNTLKHGGKLLLLADPVKDIIVGSSWMTFDGRRVFLHHFGIRKKYQRKGWGLLLAKECFSFIKQNGCQVKLEVHKENLAAKKLYEKLGFFAFTDYDIYMIRDLDKVK